MLPSPGRPVSTVASMTGTATPTSGTALHAFEDRLVESEFSRRHLQLRGSSDSLNRVVEGALN